MPMKRINLVLDEEILKKATQLMGAKTYSEAVNKALVESIRLAEIRGLSEILGKVDWEGDLGEMRRDAPMKSIKRKKK